MLLTMVVDEALIFRKISDHKSYNHGFIPVLSVVFSSALPGRRVEQGGECLRGPLLGEVHGNARQNRPGHPRVVPEKRATAQITARTSAHVTLLKLYLLNITPSHSFHPVFPRMQNQGFRPGFRPQFRGPAPPRGPRGPRPQGKFNTREEKSFLLFSNSIFLSSFDFTNLE